MPNNSGQPFILGMIFLFFGFFMVFSWWMPAIITGVGIIIMLAVRSFERDHGHHISVKEIAKTEAKLRGDGV
ncbi:Quinol oxidase subunit 1 [compost metagenome]